MRIEYYKKVSSTNALAKAIKPEPWTVVWAEIQTNGYGKQKREWFSPKGGLYFTVVLPEESPHLLPFLNLTGGLAVARALQNYKIHSSLKWPNDVLVKNKKIAGILSENIIGKKTEFSIMGIGFNTNIKKFPQQLKKSATSIEIEFQKVDNKEVLMQTINELKKVLKLKKKEALKEYKSLGFNKSFNSSKIKKYGL